jgi:aryl-alcohol dehydrogenase-like predicted oxidoreductase
MGASSMKRSRRQFISWAGTGLALSACSRRHDDATGLRLDPADMPSPGARSSPVPRRPLGRTGVDVSILGIGGSHLGDVRDPDEAMRIVHEAIDAGINFFDNAWEYHDGKSEEVLGRALAGKRDQVFLMTKVCSHGRNADVALAQLEDSLRRLGTDHLDLWQVHECIYDNDPERHFAAGGVIEALGRAKEQGKVRFVGFTGHKNPSIHLAMLEHGFPFDTVQMPLNCFDGTFRSFEQQVVPEAVKRGIAPIGMKSLTGAGDPIREGVVTVEEALRYAMSIPGVATTVSGIDALDILHQNLAIARGFEPMPPEAMQALRDRVRDVAADGRMELYKTTTHYDAKVGREQHGYPTQQELPL